MIWGYPHDLGNHMTYQIGQLEDPAEKQLEV